MINPKVMQEFVELCYKFNEVAGKGDDYSLAEVRNQARLIFEEASETVSATGLNLPTHVLDGAVDVMVTAIGLLQKLEAAGCDVETALLETAQNNMTKFTTDMNIAMDSVTHYINKGEDVRVEDFNLGWGNKKYFIVKDRNNKVRKPIDYKSNDLSAYVPVELKKGF